MKRKCGAASDDNSRFWIFVTIFSRIYKTKVDIPRSIGSAGLSRGVLSTAGLFNKRHKN